MDETGSSGDLGDLLEARRRIVAAFEGIAEGAEALAAKAALLTDLDRLRAEVEEERIVNAQLQERVRALRDRENGRLALEEEVTRLRAEVAELRAARDAERGEIDTVLSELIPIVEEAR
jgi:precorrin isomerase